VLRRTAAIAGLAVISAALAACGGTDGNASPKGAGGSASTTTPPASSSAPTTTTSAAAAGPICENGQLAVRTFSEQPAAGTVPLILRFVNVGKTTCRLSGYPGVAALNFQGVQVVQATRGATVPTTVSLAPGQTASATLFGSDDRLQGTTPCPLYPALLVTPPNATESVKVDVAGPDGTGLPGCNALGINPVVPGANGQVG